MSDKDIRDTLPDGATLMEDLPPCAPAPSREPLTVGKLRQVLEGFEDDAVIYSEGCDCSEAAHKVEIGEWTHDGKAIVEIRR